MVIIIIIIILILISIITVIIIIILILTPDTSFPSPEDGGGAETVLLKGESVLVVGASPRRGHLLVDHQGHSVHVPFQYMELKPSAQPGVNI